MVGANDLDLAVDKCLGSLLGSPDACCPFIGQKHTTSGKFFLNCHPQSAKEPPLVTTMNVLCFIIKVIICSAAEAEPGALFSLACKVSLFEIFWSKVKLKLYFIKHLFSRVALLLKQQL